MSEKDRGVIHGGWGYHLPLLIEVLLITKDRRDTHLREVQTIYALDNHKERCNYEDLLQQRKSSCSALQRASYQRNLLLMMLQFAHTHRRFGG
jgi:hypothetical protein